MLGSGNEASEKQMSWRARWTLGDGLFRQRDRPRESPGNGCCERDSKCPHSACILSLARFLYSLGPDGGPSQMGVRLTDALPTVSAPPVRERGTEPRAANWNAGIPASFLSRAAHAERDQALRDAATPGLFNAASLRLPRSAHDLAIHLRSERILSGAGHGHDYGNLEAPESVSSPPCPNARAAADVCCATHCRNIHHLLASTGRTPPSQRRIMIA